MTTFRALQTPTIAGAATGIRQTTRSTYAGRTQPGTVATTRTFVMDPATHRVRMDVSPGVYGYAALGWARDTTQKSRYDLITRNTKLATSYIALRNNAGLQALGPASAWIQSTEQQPNPNLLNSNTNYADFASLASMAFDITEIGQKYTCSFSGSTLTVTSAAFTSTGALSSSGTLTLGLDTSGRITTLTEAVTGRNAYTQSGTASYGPQTVSLPKAITQTTFNNAVVRGLVPVLGNSISKAATAPVLAAPTKAVAIAAVRAATKTKVKAFLTTYEWENGREHLAVTTTNVAGGVRCSVTFAGTSKGSFTTTVSGKAIITKYAAPA